MAGPSDTRAVFRSRWRGIRPRLIAILLVPTAAALVLGAMRAQAAFTDSAEAARAESIADALPVTFHLAVQLTAERDAATSDLPRSTLRQVEAATDDAIEQWRHRVAGVDTSHNPALQRDLLTAGESLAGIQELRDELAARRTREAAHAEYTATLNLLLGLSSRLPALDDQDVYRQTDALAQVRTASEALGVERRVVAAALLTGRVSDEDRTALTRAQAAWAAASREFFHGTSPAARERFDEITGGTGADGGTGGEMQSLVDQLVTTGDVDALGITPEEWLAVSTEFITAMEAVIVRAATDLAEDVSATRTSAQRAAVVSAAAVLLVLLAALVAVALAARSILRPLARLREAALHIAHRELPERVRALEASEGPVDTSVEPIGIRRRDEIGELAVAFEAVHSEAVRLAGEQAQMRANVNRMFVNLARRSQSLVERQLRLIDQLEAGEQDPDDLAHLFQLDHLATRMRRNGESLLVLAGGDTGQTGRGDVPVLDVLRAATSEIEQFARVDVETRETCRVRGPVAGDLVHLLAELVENATSFSAPDTRVTLRAVRSDPAGPLVVEVRDLGIGMRPDELAAANAKLQRTGGLDADVARRMGLVVTARLADRHGLSVGLSANSPRGTVARVVVPPAALAAPDAPPRPSYVVPPAAPVVAPPAPADAVLRTWLDSTVPLEQAAALTGQAPAPLPAPPTDPVAAPVTARRPAAPRFPSLEPSALDIPARSHEEESPIFATLQSEWFTRRTPLSGRHRAATASAGRGGWSSPADLGWQRAAEVSEKRDRPPAAVTPGGLPKRVPGQHLVPGAAPAVATPAPAVPQPPRSRSLSSFQQGVRRARSAVDPLSPDHATEGGAQ